jgi:homoserine kinase
MKPSSARAPVFNLALPATSANLGPAFDAAALAFSLWIKVSARAADHFSVSASGRDAEVCRTLEKHLILETYREILVSESKPVIPLALRIDNQMPIGKGCGSSAAARLAGIALAVHFGKLRWAGSRIIGEASWREHHPDNAAACWMGGIAVARMSGERQAQVANLQPKGKWPLLFAVPRDPLSTEQARQVLPREYSRSDAVVNIQNAMLLVTAFTQGRRDLLASALDDRIHQPYRAPLCPLLPALQSMTGRDGVLGSALSGAGPSVLVFLDPKVPASRVKARIGASLRQRQLEAELILTSITASGARDHLSWRKNE